MLSDSEKNAALLAVSRYGAEPSKVFAVVQQMLDRRARGESADLLDCLENENLLTIHQARELRLGLEKTTVEFFPKNDAGELDVNSAATMLPRYGDDDEDDDEAEPIDVRALGDYRILRQLGAGGTGAVFLAYHEKENQQVAIKVLARKLAKSQSAVDRFYREAKSGAILHHPNIVRNIAVGQDQQTGLYYLVLEYVEGPSALDLLDQNGRLAVGDAVHIILDIAHALEYMHLRSVIHRDIKPGNILIALSGLAKLADMGLAKRIDETSHLTHARQGFGTPYYMPYEQAMNAKYADERCDIFALGATLYHLVTGEVPFTGADSLEIIEKKEVGVFTPASLVNPDVPRVLDNIFAKTMAREPRQRYQSASELIVDLEHTNLAAALPSFIDADRAMMDPTVRARLAAPAVTAPDLRPGLDRPFERTQEQVWYLRYQDRHGQPCKAKLTQDQVVAKLRAGKFSPQIEAARLPQGDYKPLSSLGEFQEALLEAPQCIPAGETKNAQTFLTFSGWWIVFGAGLGIVLLLAGTLFMWLHGW